MDIEWESLNFEQRQEKHLQCVENLGMNDDLLGYASKVFKVNDTILLSRGTSLVVIQDEFMEGKISGYVLMDPIIKDTSKTPHGDDVVTAEYKVKERGQNKTLLVSDLRVSHAWGVDATRYVLDYLDGRAGELECNSVVVSDPDLSKLNPVGMYFMLGKHSVAREEGLGQSVLEGIFADRGFKHSHKGYVKNDVAELCDSDLKDEACMLQ